MTGTWEALVDGRADLALAVGQPPAAGGLRTRILADIGFRFCVAPQHPLAAWPGVVPSTELRRHRHIVVSDSARRLTPRTVGLLPGQSVLAVPDMRTKYALQAAGLGVGFLPAAFVASALGRGLLVEKAVEQPKPDDHVLLAWRTSQPGKGLKWWREALADPPVVPQFLARASRAWVSEY
jgi:DNA-binding transcriptional LysR family regulator